MWFQSAWGAFCPITQVSSHSPSAMNEWMKEKYSDLHEGVNPMKTIMLTSCLLMCTLVTPFTPPPTQGYSTGGTPQSCQSVVRWEKNLFFKKKQTYWPPVVIWVVILSSLFITAALVTVHQCVCGGGGTSCQLWEEMMLEINPCVKAESRQEGRVTSGQPLLNKRHERIRPKGINCSPS